MDAGGRLAVVSGCLPLPGEAVPCISVRGRPRKARPRALGDPRSLLELLPQLRCVRVLDLVLQLRSRDHDAVCGPKYLAHQDSCAGQPAPVHHHIVRRAPNGGTGVFAGRRIHWCGCVLFRCCDIRVPRPARPLRWPRGIARRHDRFPARIRIWDAGCPQARRIVDIVGAHQERPRAFRQALVRRHLRRRRRERVESALRIGAAAVRFVGRGSAEAGRVRQPAARGKPRRPLRERRASGPAAAGPGRGACVGGGGQGHGRSCVGGCGLWARVSYAWARGWKRAVEAVGAVGGEGGAVV
mmetsp:Transcript_16313/g.44277  ORF Transcript_16313/g.44277 Transcript_16313/m.44277 type:complete len:298 (-) Transcript_16313:411-1304(-)